MSQRKKDQVYQNPLAEITDFEFDINVVNVFEDMINRSVPGYGTIIHNIANFAQLFAQQNSNCYDLGCSLGASTLSMRQALENTSGITIYSIDSSEDMLERAQGYLEKDSYSTPVIFQQGDICDADISNASFVALNFTLQFIDPDKRAALINNIYAGMKPEGCLILSEKIQFSHPAQQIITNIHHQFKREQGYSELEIAQKRDALENVMQTETQQAHLDRLKNAGFETVQQWYQHSAFCSFFAIK